MYTARLQEQLGLETCCPTALKSVTHSTAFGGSMIGSLVTFLQQVKRSYGCGLASICGHCLACFAI